jgi:hypothetical protein
MRMIDAVQYVYTQRRHIIRNELFLELSLCTCLFLSLEHFPKVVGTVVDQNKIGQSKFRLCNSIFLRNPSLRKQKCQK